MACWATEEEFEKDLESYDELSSKIEAPRDPPPPTILEYKARMGANQKGSIYDPFSPNEEDGILVNRGRGRGGFQIYTPGFSNNNIKNNNTKVSSKYDDDEEDILRRMKEIGVAGYSNEAIEQSYWSSLGKSAPRRKFNDYKEFCDVSETTNSATASPKKPATPINSFAKGYSSAAESPVKSEKSFNGLSVRTFESSSVSSRSSSPAIIEEIMDEKDPSPTPPSDGAPLPLSVLLNRAKKKRKNIGNQAVKKATLPNLQNRNDEVAVNGYFSNNIENGYNHSTTLTESNKFWWSNPSSESGSDESLSWRKRTNSPPKFFNGKNKPYRSKRDFDLESGKDFPAL